MTITVAALNCYPVKSCRGIALGAAEVTPMGLPYDRQWTVIDATGDTASRVGGGRLNAVFCLVDTRIEGDTLRLNARDMQELVVPLAGREGPEIIVSQIFDRCPAVDQGDEAAAWLGKFLKRAVPAGSFYRLMRYPDNALRETSMGKGPIAYVDKFPHMIMSQATLDDLNRRMGAPLPMARFRPNIVLDGCEPYDEDRIARMRIGNLTFIGARRCVRCAVTATDIMTGDGVKEPLATLATYRREDKGVTLGRYFVHGGTGTIAVGDEVKVTAWQ